jgi:hypothetical protein
VTAGTQSGTQSGTRADTADRTVSVDSTDVLKALDYYDEQRWTDGLPVVPVTESYLAGFLAVTDRDPEDTVFSMPHLEKQCSVRTAAINAAMAGCRPEYFPVVLAAWEGFTREGYAPKGIWQSTTGTAPFLIVNGPVRDEIGLNGKGNVFGSGFRANATIARAIRLTAINCFGLRPHELDQATQGTPAKYTACIAENEEQSPWPAFHCDQGLAATDSAVTAMVIRSVVHIEARHTNDPEQLGRDLAGTLARGPGHASLFDRAGWSKQDVRDFVYENAANSRERLAEVGKDAVSGSTRWRLPAGHPDAVPDRHTEEGREGPIKVLSSPEALQVVVAGANNAGVSAVVETFGPRGEPPATVRVEPAGSRGSSATGRG